LHNNMDVKNTQHFRCSFLEELLFAKTALSPRLVTWSYLHRFLQSIKNERLAAFIFYGYE